MAGDPEPVHQVAVLGLDRKIIVSGSRDARVAAIATRQRGRVARRQLLAAGLSSGQIHHLARTDRLFAELPGVYCVGSRAPVALARETAALLAVREGAMLSNPSAAPLWGLPADSAASREIHVTVAGGWIPRPAGVVGHRSRILADADRRVRHGLPVCSPAWLLLELAAAGDERLLNRAFDEARIAGIVRPGEISELLRRAGRRPGAWRLAALVAAGETEVGVSRSDAERLLASLLGQTDIPTPQRNVRVCGFLVDCLWPEAGLVVEIDGYRFHSGRRRFESDRVRDARLAAADIEVMRVTWRQLTQDQLAVIARIAAAVTRRTRRR